MAKERNFQPAPEPGMDKKEMGERVKAAESYFEESPSHYVQYLEDCVQVSMDATSDIRDQWDECWRVFNEEEPMNFGLKEAWQTRVTIPKPYSTGQHGIALIRKAFELEFLSIEDKLNPDAASFWKKLLGVELSENYGNFAVEFSGAAGMSLAIGQSMEMIPQWRPGRGLYFDIIEPWKIFRDPNSLSRQPQSGLWWIHQEYMPYHELKKAEDDGRYFNIGEWGPGSWGKSTDPHATEEEIARRKNMVHVRGKFQNDVLVREFWGTILSPKGEEILPRGTFTVGGDQLISPPIASYYETLRWPGMGFAALPHLLRFEGRGMIQGIKSLWYLMCNLMSLHADNLNWIVNPMVEVDIYSLIDQTDVDIWPGKVVQTRATVQGQPVMRPVDMKSQTGDILANVNKIDMMMQEGMMINYAAMGNPGYRQGVTAREAAQNLDQSMTVVGNVGKNIEGGALSVIRAATEVIAANITYEELAHIVGEEEARKYRTDDTETFPTGLNLPSLTSGSMHISGISSLMRDKEILENLNNFAPLFDKPIFAAYLEPHGYIKAWVKRSGLEDEGIMVSDEKAREIAERQQAQQDAAIEHQAATEAMGPQTAQTLADKQMAQAEKARAEAMANEQQAGLFEAQAGAVQPPGAEGMPPEGMVQ